MNGDLNITRKNEEAADYFFREKRYSLIREIGRGGMGTVFEAFDNTLKRRVAIKVLADFLAKNENLLKRFEREAQLAASLGDHPNIVNIYDLHAREPLQYIAMEYVDGVTLDEFIARNKGRPFSLAQALPILQQVASALSFAHKTGVIHRDIKPSNIMVTKTGLVKVLDFGLAKSTYETIAVTKAGSTLGTPFYMSPEQALGNPADHHSDIYSFGIIVYELLTGTVPFLGDTPVSVGLKHVNSEIPSPSKANPAITPVLEQSILKALDKEPSRRYGDVLLFIRDISSSGADGSPKKKRTRLAAAALACLVCAYCVWTAHNRTSTLSEAKMLPQPVQNRDQNNAFHKSDQTNKAASAAAGTDEAIKTNNTLAEEITTRTANIRLRLIPSVHPDVKPFYAGVFPVSVKEWDTVLKDAGEIHSHASGKPVFVNSIRDCELFIKELCSKESVPPGTFRLFTKDDQARASGGILAQRQEQFSLKARHGNRRIRENIFGIVGLEFPEWLAGEKEEQEDNGPKPFRIAKKTS